MVYSRPLRASFVLYVSALMVAFGFLCQTLSVFISGSSTIFTALGATLAALALFTFSLFTRRPPRRTFSYVIFTVTALITAAFAVLKGLYSDEIAAIEPATLWLAGSLFLGMVAALWVHTTGRYLHSADVRGMAWLLVPGLATSFAALVGLLVYFQSGWTLVDPVGGILLSTACLASAALLGRHSIQQGGLSSPIPPQLTRQLTELLSERCAHYGITFQDFAHSFQEGRHRIDLNLIFPASMPTDKSHAIASELEILITNSLGNRVQITLHLVTLPNTLAPRA